MLNAENLFESWKHALRPIPAREPWYDEYRPAAVTLLLGVEKENVSLLMIKRSQTLRTHKGQWAFPGGAIDTGENATEAACREFEEELGQPLNPAWLAGHLMDSPTISKFVVRSFVAVAAKDDVEQSGFKPSAAEVDHVAWIPIQAFAQPGRYQRLVGWRGGVPRSTHGFQTPQAYVWGASAELVFRMMVLGRRLEGVDLGIARAEFLDPARDFVHIIADSK